jgi:hypothetical protein
MREILVVVGLAIVGCASTRAVCPSETDGNRKSPAVEASQGIGGSCHWSIKEGAKECIVEISSETRRRASDGLVHTTEGYGEFTWSCGEKDLVCGDHIECTCPFSATADGGVRPDGGS